MTEVVPFGSARLRDGRWQLRYRTAGRETSCTHDTFPELLAESCRLAALTADGRRAQYVGGRLTVLEVAQLWMRSSGHAYSTQLTKWSHLRNHILPEFHDVPLSKLTRVGVERWAGQLTAGLSPKTAQRVLRILRAVVLFGLKRGWTDHDHTAGIWIPGAGLRSSGPGTDRRDDERRKGDGSREALRARSIAVAHEPRVDRKWTRARSRFLAGRAPTGPHAV